MAYSRSGPIVKRTSVEILIHYASPLTPSGVMPNVSNRPLTQLAANCIAIGRPYH